MQIFNIGVNPLIQQLERNLQGITLYSLPVCGPALEHEVDLNPLKKTTSIIGYVDDLNPVITKVEEFEICNTYLLLFEKASGCQFHRDPTSQKCKITPLGRWKEWMHCWILCPLQAYFSLFTFLGLCVPQDPKIAYFSLRALNFAYTSTNISKLVVNPCFIKKETKTNSNDFILIAYIC